MKPRPWWVSAVQFTGIGWYVGTSIVVPTLVGAWLDGKTGLSPLFLLAGLFLGLAVAFYGTYRMLMTFLVEQRGSKHDEGPRS